MTDRSSREVETGNPDIHWEEASHPVRWGLGWGALLGLPSAFLIAYLGMRLYFIAHITGPTTYPAHDLPAGYVAFWCAVVAVPSLTALLLGIARHLRNFTVGWLLTFVPLCAMLTLSIVSLDTDLLNH